MAGPERANKPLTPVMRQHQAAKAAYPDAILLFRLGDFYELFHDDARVAARELDLTLTSRNKGAVDEVPMAGVPAHAAAGYIAKLLAAGHKVAICEQLGDPSKIKGIVPREVVRVLTPGLVTDGDQLDGRANHWLCAIDGAAGSARVGLARLDLSTGELGATELDDAGSLVAELARLDPREVLVGPDATGVAALVRATCPRAAVRDEGALEPGAVDEAFARVLGAEASDDAARAPRFARIAAARVLRFAVACNPGASLPVRRLSTWDAGATLRLDEATQAHLELVRAQDGSTRGTLLSTLDATRTPPGARLLRRRLLAPLVDPIAIRARLDAVEGLVRHALARDELRAQLAGVGDLERLAVRASLGEATPRDLGALRDGLLAAPQVVAAVESIPDAAAREALGLPEGAIDLVADLAARLAAALTDRPPALAREGGIVREGFDAALDEAKRLKDRGSDAMIALEGELREASGIPSLKVRYTRVFGWYAEVTRSHAAKVPPTFRRKQTVAGAERYTTDALDELQTKISEAEERFSTREAELFAGLLGEASARADRVRALSERLAAWDVAAALADVAHRRDYCRPDVDDGDVLALDDARHPVVEQLAAGGRFVPNDVTLDLEAERMWIVTGPNMAGKSTFMRQTALAAILAQMGSYVPAKHARVGVVDRVLSRVGASDNVSRGESTFMVEMRETANILARATRRSLVVLDEVGRGTSTYDGLAIAWAVAEHLHDAIGCRTLFATHYHEMTELTEGARHAANYSVSAREHDGDVVFFHKVVRGAASRSYGVAVARLAGVPEGVLARAKAILASLEAGGALPSGRHANLRGRSATGAAQLDLFVPAVSVAPASSPALDTLREVDVDRLTPLDALQLVAKLKSLL